MPLCWPSRLNGRKGTTNLAEIILQVIRYKDSLKRTLEDTSNPEGNAHHKSRRRMRRWRIRIGPGLSDVLIVRRRLRSLEFLTSVLVDPSSSCSTKVCTMYNKFIQAPLNARALIVTPAIQSYEGTFIKSQGVLEKASYQNSNNILLS